METSISWYSEVFGLEVVNRTEIPERGIEQSNLTGNDLQIELIELASAISPSEALEPSQDKNRIRGLFKIGLKVRDFDKWKTHLYKKDIILFEDLVRDPVSGKRTAVFNDPDNNRIPLFEL